MDPVRTLGPLVPVANDSRAIRTQRFREQVVDGLRDYGPLALALAGGALIGATSTGAWPVGAERAQAARVLLVGALAAAAILPRRGMATPAGSGPDVSRTVRRSAVFAGLFALLALGSLVRDGLRPELALVPLVAALQFALALGLAFFAAAVDRLGSGRFLSARLLVPAWVLATPALWLVHVADPELVPAWNPLHQLVAAWRWILLPEPAAAAFTSQSVFALAPAALLCAVLGFVAHAAVDAEARSD